MVVWLVMQRKKRIVFLNKKIVFLNIVPNHFFLCLFIIIYFLKKGKIILILWSAYLC